MHHDAQVELLQRALKHRVRNGTDALGSATQFPAHHYVDAARLADERRALFRRLPVVAGFSAQLPQPGDHATRDCDGVPVLLVRQDDGRIAAFLNICRHRGARVVTTETGHCERVLVCPYHAWSYRSDGALHNVPCSIHFREVDRAAHGLRRLPAFERAGLVFVQADPAVADDAAAIEGFAADAPLAAYADELEGFGLHGFEVYATRVVPARTNWKMMIEANREGYHINVLHRDTAGLRFRPQLSLLDAQGPHSRAVLLHKTFAPQAMPADTADWRVLEHSDMPYFLFPNTLVLLSSLAAHVLTAFPDGPDGCVIHAATLLPPGTRPQYPHTFYDAYWDTIMEDIVVSIDIQRAAQADPGQHFWTGANEWLLPHFHAAIQRAIDHA